MQPILIIANSTLIAVICGNSVVHDNELHMLVMTQGNVHIFEVQHYISRLVVHMDSKRTIKVRLVVFERQGVS